jgi:hypothetical protein
MSRRNPMVQKNIPVVTIPSEVDAMLIVQSVLVALVVVILDLLPGPFLGVEGPPRMGIIWAMFIIAGGVGFHIAEQRTFPTNGRWRTFLLSVLLAGGVGALSSPQVGGVALMFLFLFSHAISRGYQGRRRRTAN